jgi:DNA repair protein RAD57
MTDLLHVLSDFDTAQYTHLLPSLDRARITTTDLVTLTPVDVAKRAQLPAGDVRKLRDALVQALHVSLGIGAHEAGPNSFLSSSGNAEPRISTLDERLDAALGGGIPPAYLVEVTGERYGQIQLDAYPKTTAIYVPFAPRLSTDSSQRCR